MSFLSGEKSQLRPFERENISDVQEWVNDPVTTHYMFYGQIPTNNEQAERMFCAQLDSPANILFMVVSTPYTGPQAIVGFAGLYDIHLTARKAEFRILIGDKEAHGQGIGTEVTEMLTFYAFDRLNLHRVYLGVTEDNVGAVRAYEKAGYVSEGVLRDDIYRNGRYYNTVKMAMLRPEYEEKYKAAWTAKYGQKPPVRPSMKR
jgi:RimJ/RimL family protein N-acetyltransferase